MTPDESYASLLLAGLLVIITQRQISSLLLEVLLKFTRPGATIGLLSLMLFLYMGHHHYTFLVMGLVVVFLLKDMWVQWPNSDARRLYLETSRDQARFDPSSSIDIQMANGSIKHAPPSIYGKDWSPQLLVFPPSEETLYELNG
jgi:hypothetical protein